MQWGFTENQTYIRLTNSNMSNNIDSLPLTREVDFAKQKTEGENRQTLFVSKISQNRLSLSHFVTAPSSEGAEQKIENYIRI